MLASIVFALPFFTAALAQTNGCTRSATVKAGDTCDLISHKYGVSTYQLALVNDAVISENCDNLEPGQVVCLGIEGHDCTKVYTVTLNDTCEWIESTYGINQTTLISNNPQIDNDCSSIYVGEVLCVDTAPYIYPEVNQTLYQSLAFTYLPFCDE